MHSPIPFRIGEGLGGRGPPLPPFLRRRLEEAGGRPPPILYKLVYVPLPDDEASCEDAMTGPDATEAVQGNPVEDLCTVRRELDAVVVLLQHTRHIRSIT